MKPAKEIIDHHLKAFFKGDIDGVLADYAPNIVFFTANGPLNGVPAVRPLFESMIAEFGKPGAVFSLNKTDVDGDYGYILWNAETSDNVYELGTDTFTVCDGKIVAQSFTAKIIAKH